VPTVETSTLTDAGLVTGAKPPLSVPAALTGPVQVGIKLVDAPLVVVAGANAKQHKQSGPPLTGDQQRAYLAQLKPKQDAVMATVAALGGVELGRVTKGHNALMVSIDASQVPALQSIPGVVAVRQLLDYQLSTAPPQPDLPTTLSYLGATAVQNSGFKGQGVRIAMLDGGIDYTHYNLGGSGKVSDYNAAAAAAKTTPPANLFPTAKVIGGYDFVGDVWPCPGQPGPCPLQPDPNPIDLFGHGTATADTAGGHSLDGHHSGMAPDSQLYAVKVCSSVSDSCSGTAILQGIEFALDPNNNGTLDNAVDIISMSVGGSFGMKEDDASEMFTDVVNFGVMAVISAGNDGDIPYILAHPAATPEVLALGATNGVATFLIPLVVNSPPSIAGTYPNTATLAFAPVTSPVTGNIAYVGRGCPAGSINGSNPADTYLANPSGKIALIDRGACDVSLKIDRAASAGAIGVLIGLVAPGDAFAFGLGGGSNFVPSLVITQSTSTLIKHATPPVNVTTSPANAISLTGKLASYTSRGPNYSYNMLKPDMSAPGEVVVAQAGTGNGQADVGGTSFSCPLAAGTAALLLSKNPSLTPQDLKALLMETTEPLVYQNPLQLGTLAPLSRVGAGELRADRAAAASTATWDEDNPLAVSLSFGTYRLNTSQDFEKKVLIHNYSNIARTYQIANTYRDAPNTTGVTLSIPASVFVPAHDETHFKLTLNVNAPALPIWTLNGGSQGGNGELLNTVEYAGYLTFTSGAESVHLPWHILPHKAADVQRKNNATLVLQGSPDALPLSNEKGAVSGLVNVFSLTGEGKQFPASALPQPGSDHAVINLQAVGVRLVCLGNCASNTPILGAQFAINTFGQRSHPDFPAEFDVVLDVNNDGIPDLIVFNADIGLFTGVLSGQNVVIVYDIAAGIFRSSSFTVADLDSANVIFSVPLSLLKTKSGLQLNYNTPFTFSVQAYDNYFTGRLTDQIGPMHYELDMPQIYANDVLIPAGSSASIQVTPNDAANVFFSGPYNGNSPSQTGLLLMYKDAPAGQEAEIVDKVKQ